MPHKELIVKLKKQGFSNQEIAEQLTAVCAVKISSKTVAEVAGQGKKKRKSRTQKAVL